MPLIRNGKPIDLATMHGRLDFLIPDGVSDGQWAKKLGTSQATLSPVLNGHTQPSLKLCIRVCQETGCNLDWIVFGRGLPHGGIDIDRFKVAVRKTLNIALDAALRSEPLSETTILNTFLSHYQSEMADELEYVKTYGIKKSLTMEASNDPSALSDKNRKKVP